MNDFPSIRRAIALGVAMLALAGCSSHTTGPGNVSTTPAPPAHSWPDLGLTRSWAEADAITDYGGALVVGGAFFDAAGTVRSDLVQRVGSRWTLLGPQSNSNVLTLTVHAGRLVAGGTFTRMGGDSAGYIAAWDGARWDPLGGGVDWDVLALTEWNGDLVAGGVFLHAGGVPARLIARWDGSAWHPLGLGCDDVVAALTVYHGELIAGGWFKTAGAAPARYIAAWNGTSWHPLGAADALDGVVRALFVHHDTLFVGGHFSRAGSVPAYHVACWNGAAWDSVGRGLGNVTIEGVLAFTAWNDHLVAGGAFLGGVAEWKAGLWFPLGTLNGDVTSLAVHGGELVAGGSFSTTYGSEPNHLARWVE